MQAARPPGWVGEPGQEALLGSLLPQIFLRGGLSHFDLPEGLREPFRLRLIRQSGESPTALPGAGVVVFEAVLGAVSQAKEGE